eukprot:m.40730 g.40730  ORF g.40730 m.40730 type:complete len:328 (+) comp12775_c0_seq1:110-1093(+)
MPTCLQTADDESFRAPEAANSISHFWEDCLLLLEDQPWRDIIQKNSDGANSCISTTRHPCVIEHLIEKDGRRRYIVVLAPPRGESERQWLGEHLELCLNKVVEYIGQSIKSFAVVPENRLEYCRQLALFALNYTAKRIVVYRESPLDLEHTGIKNLPKNLLWKPLSKLHRVGRPQPAEHFIFDSPSPTCVPEYTSEPGVTAEASSPRPPQLRQRRLASRRQWRSSHIDTIHEEEEEDSPVEAVSIQQSRPNTGLSWLDVCRQEVHDMLFEALLDTQMEICDGYSDSEQRKRVTVAQMHLTKEAVMKTLVFRDSMLEQLLEAHDEYDC